MSGFKTRSKQRAARLAQEGIYTENDRRLLAHRSLHTDTLPFRIGKPPTKTEMVERGKGLVSDMDRQRKKAFMTVIFKGHETLGGPIVERTREEWLELLQSGIGIATYGDIRASGPAMVIDGQLRSRVTGNDVTPEMLVRYDDLFEKIAKSVVC